jgi:glutamyl-Q tRNA(Asp) synthetase
MEDIDSTRSHSHYESELLEDLAWLGLDWEPQIRRQSQHYADYQQALDVLQSRGLLYPCFCTRREIQAELARASSAPQGPDGPLYPGTCRSMDPSEQSDRIASGVPYALRLHTAKAMRQVGKPLRWTDLSHGTHTAQPEIFGDVVLARKEIPTSYHLAVVVDDALQSVTHVTRGEDLLPATHLHRLLQELLDLPAPQWQHHRLILDAEGKRLAKRDHSTSLRTLRSEGHTPEEVWSMVMFTL